MIVGSTGCYENGLPGRQVYGAMENFSTAEANLNSLVYSISMLSEKVNQIQTLVHTTMLPDCRPQGYSSMVMASVSSLIQEIMLTTSSMIITCQKMADDAANSNQRKDNHRQTEPEKICDDSSSRRRLEVEDQVMQMEGDVGATFIADDALERYFHLNVNNHNSVMREGDLNDGAEKIEVHCDRSAPNSDVIELDAADLLAKYTHYCQICGKGFKRDANLRMHMRAHGDEYKSNAALSNPMKKGVNNSRNSGQYISHADSPRKYSCPQEGCRWNKKHAKFQPLKSMICAKNHYKRSHCPKMYVCNRCNNKQFSLLSDLRTHEKHCGDLKWHCSCGTTFSRKDKLMGHVALFVGHTPVAKGYMEQGRQNHFG